MIFPTRATGGGDAFGLRHLREGVAICSKPVCEPGDAVVFEEFFGEVRSESGDVAPRSILGDDAWFFLVGLSKANEFHECVS